MTAEALSRVWRNSLSAGSARLVLLAIADCAHGSEPPTTFLTVGSIMQMTGLGERTVQIAVRTLRGTDDDDNIQTQCLTCNKRKGARQ